MEEGRVMKAVSVENTGRLLSIYCPSCGKVTDKISFNLLREAGGVTAICPVCGEITLIDYDGKRATVYHRDEAIDEFISAVRKNNAGKKTKER
jgi:predicted RNA-binding Zn-ribbon protein involved in translation (DUF1610 family)